MTEQRDGGSHAGEAGAVPRTAAIDALRRLLGSETFADSPRARDFLAFVARETLDGRGHRLKERTIARAALERPDSFDPRNDAGVRVQARRVRLLLDRYYAEEGVDDEIRVDLPKGSYVPVFAIAPGEPASPTGATTLGPGIAVVRFSRPDDDPDAAAMAVGLTESLVSALSSFPGIRVVGPVDAEGPASSGPQERRLGSRLDVHYVVRGAVADRDGATWVTIRLVDAATGDVVWAESFDRSTLSAGFHGQDDLVRRVAGVVGDYSGAALRHASRSRGETTNPVVWEAMLDFYDGLERATPATADALRSTLLQAHAIEPQNPVLLSMLASTESFLAVYGAEADRSAMVDACDAHARSALVLDPASSHAHLTLGMAEFSRGNETVALEHLRLAVDQSPWNPTILYGAAWIYGLVGDWDTGVTLMRESVRLNPSSPTMRYLFLAVDELMSEDFAAALADGMRYPHTDDFWQPLVLALALDGLGRVDEAQVEVARALALDPHLLETVRESAEFPPKVIAFIVPRLEALLWQESDGS